MAPDDSRTVYSSEHGRMCPACGKSSKRCKCAPRRQRAPEPAGPADGTVRVGRESKGRRGKTVTTITGVPAEDVAELSGELKRLCGTGGALKAGVIEIQGDHRDRLVEELVGRGYRVKRTGG